jgi:hypothetical protein
MLFTAALFSKELFLVGQFQFIEKMLPATFIILEKIIEEYDFACSLQKVKIVKIHEKSNFQIENEEVF